MTYPICHIKGGLVV